MGHSPSGPVCAQEAAPIFVGEQRHRLPLAPRAGKSPLFTV